MSANNYLINITTDKPDAIYNCNENIQFKIEIMCNNILVTDGSVKWEIKKDLTDPLDSGELLLNSQNILNTSLDCPGFISCTVTYSPENQDPVTQHYGAAVSPLDIQPSLPVPEDFDDFWDQQKERLANVPMEVTMEKGEAGDIELYDIKISSVDETPVSGYYAKPKGALPRNCPAITFTQGAGVYSSNKERITAAAKNGYIALEFNAHGLENGKDGQFYLDIQNNELAGYSHRGMTGKREDVYFLNMFLRVKRALEFLTNQEEWDGKNLFSFGHSQGAFQAFAGAYLDKRVTAIAVGVPAGSDLTGFVKNRVTGWPMPNAIIDKDPSLKATVINNVRYFDNMNFASRISIPAIFSVGFVDTLCNPTTVYAVYNNYQGQKQMINCPKMGHVAPEEISQQFLKFLDECKK